MKGIVFALKITEKRHDCEFNLEEATPKQLALAITHLETTKIKLITAFDKLTKK